MKKSFKIKTIKSGVNEVSFSPERGGIVTSLKINGKEILYFDEETFKNTDVSVRGGIPILFPNAGDLKENRFYPNLKRHGFVRDMTWRSLENNNGFEETLSSDQSTKLIYPHNFILSVLGSFNQDDSFDLTQIIENKGEEDMPIASGLHPYFRVTNAEKKNIKFNFDGGKEIEEQFEVWANGGTVYIDNPKIKNPDQILEIQIPQIGNLVLDPGVEYQKIWIWSQTGKDFICIEPIHRSLNGFLENPLKIKPGLTLKTNFRISLK